MAEFSNTSKGPDSKGPDSKAIPTDGSAIMNYSTEEAKALDYANYFCSYSFLYHQKQMLMDHVRMRAYHSAIMANKDLFKGKVVLDVGSGSGVLSLWAAKAGAAKVFACEFTDMANFAREMVESNGLSDVVEVMQCSAEDLDLPCKVDIIISEWMGYLLLRESMLDSVIRARDKWMKPEGSMFPSFATMYFAPICFEQDREMKSQEYQGSMHEWSKFTSEMKTFYDLNMSSLDKPFRKEQKDYYIYSGLWTELEPHHVVGEPFVIKTLDLNTCTLEDADGVVETPFSCVVKNPNAPGVNDAEPSPGNTSGLGLRPTGTVSGFAGWFTVDFHGSAGMPVTNKVTLSTGPEAGYVRHTQETFV
jgi:type I protein arginine methyltransferase